MCLVGFFFIPVSLVFHAGLDKFWPYLLAYIICFIVYVVSILITITSKILKAELILEEVKNWMEFQDSIVIPFLRESKLPPITEEQYSSYKAFSNPRYLDKN